MGCQCFVIGQLWSSLVFCRAPFVLLIRVVVLGCLCSDCRVDQCLVSLRTGGVCSLCLGSEGSGVESYRLYWVVAIRVAGL